MEMTPNGGPTLTHALLAGSPAIDGGNTGTPGSGGNACAATDQRGALRPADGDGNGGAVCDIGAYEAGASVPPAGGTITYLYDNLYRLLAASYSTGEVFTYTYDALGNRLTQTTITNTTAYTYDIANRLVNVAGQAYTWDNNGNLLSDGAMSYAYDSGNRPVTITQGANTYVFGYDGTGNRRRQLLNGVPTTYTLDLNAALVQVLADGSGNTYLYGNGPIAQQSATATGYFLPDALGSVRQLADASGNVTLAKSYDPYGNVLRSAGTGSSIYGFTGEVTDATGLVYLRARFYSPTTGRFFVQDSWHGDVQMPATLHAYLYGLNDPINHTDPSGRCLTGAIIDTILCGALIGGVAGGVVGGVGYAVTHQGQNWDTQDFAGSLGTGILAGIVGGATFGAGAAVFGTGFAATVASGAISGVASGQVSRALENVLLGQDIRTGLGDPTDIVRDATFGGATAGLIYAGVPLVTRLAAKPVMRYLTTSANQALMRNPALLQTILKPGEYAILAQNPFEQGSALYGRAVERLVAQRIEGSLVLRLLCEYKGMRSGVDFLGREWWEGLRFDTTTPARVPAHMLRPGYEDVIYLTYRGPLSK
jgi:RHS repeat-associated protein